MALTLSKLAANTATVAIPLDGDTLNIVYLPNEITEKVISEVVANTATAGQFLAQVIKSWDLYQDDAETIMYPTDAASLSALGIPVLTAVINGIVEDSSPNSSAAKTAS
jgi:hypothetical protein